MNFPTGTSPLVFALRANTANQIANGVVFGDGLLCLGGTIQRLTNALAHDGKVIFHLNHAAGTGRYDYQHFWFRNLPQALLRPAPRVQHVERGDAHLVSVPPDGACSIASRITPSSG